MALSGARPKGARQATGREPGCADANPHDGLICWTNRFRVRASSYPQVDRKRS